MGTHARRSEADVEAHLIDVLGEGHNQWTYRPDITSEDALWNNLRQKITQNNLSEIGETPLTDGEFAKLKLALLARTTTPVDAAKWLKGENGIARLTIERDDTTLGSLSLVLFSNLDINGGGSSYEVVNQVAKRAVDGERDRRFDVTLLINGLPIVQIELKQISAKDGVYQAFNQIKKYAEEGMFRNNIFSTLQLFVVSNEQTTRYFANAQPDKMHRKFLFSWRTTDNKKVDNLYECCKQMLNIPEAHRLIARYMIVSEDADNRALLVLHPYQVHAIEALTEAARRHQSGYVWHATGSGKTLTSFVATKLLAREPGIDRTIMLVDRKDLDNQTTSEFTKFASEFDTGVSSGNAKSNALIIGTGTSQELSDALLADANANTVIITTRQKLESAMEKAEKSEAKNGKNRFNKLKGQHLVFIVDECHRALSAENMANIKQWFPRSTWFGFTGTPIMEENQKQANGQLARITRDQYGDRLHTYTIKNALEDGAVLGFQVEHEDTIDATSLYNRIFDLRRHNPKYAQMTDDDIARDIDAMDGSVKETYLDSSVYENDAHIQAVIRKIFRPDNAYTKFDFRNGKPTKSAILTTSSIEMAKRYYQAINEMTRDDNWLETVFADKPIRRGRTIDDADFPRIAITYSLDENENKATKKQNEMSEIIVDYNAYYQTSWSIATLDQYNGDINNRLARKKAEFQEFGNQIDLVIVVDRLLTGFDAPTCQTLFVDRTMEYAGLIQAFSRTNRTYPEKEKGLIVTFRKKYTMEQNVANATRLYSDATEETGLIYPTYKESKQRFKKAVKSFETFVSEVGEVDEHSPLETRVDYVKKYQELRKSYDALITYDDYNDDLVGSRAMREQVAVIQENEGHYQTVKGSLVGSEPDDDDSPVDYSELEFYSDYHSQAYDIDSAYIDQLLGTYSANRVDVRQEIEDAMQKLNKADSVKDVYHRILNAMDQGEISETEDIFSIKRRFFTDEINQLVHDFAMTWCVSEDELHTSMMEYTTGMKDIPKIGTIQKSGDFDAFGQVNPDVKKFQYPQQMKRAWREMLDTQVVPLEDELR